MPLKQVRDDNNAVVSKVLGYQYGGARKLIANTSSSNSTSFASEVEMVTVVADAPVFFEQTLGTAPTANTASHYLLANTPYDIKLRVGDVNADAYIAFLGAALESNVYISPRV